MKKAVSLSIMPLQAKFGDKKALEIASEIGVDAVDFDTQLGRFDYRKKDSIYSKSDEEIFNYFNDLRLYAEKLGIYICQTHSRCEGFKNIPEEDEALTENIRRDLLACSALGAKLCVVHAVTTIFLGPNADPQLMRDLNFRMFNTILPFAKQYGVKIATETFGDAVKFDCCDFFGNIDEFIKSYNRICAVGDNKDWLTVCVDTGHSNKASRFNGNPEPGDVIRMLGGNIELLHLNDNDKLTDQHKIPLTGTIDWDDVFNALDEVGYNGVYNMELGLQRIGGKDMEIETADYAVKVMRNILKQRYGGYCLSKK